MANSDAVIRMRFRRDVKQRIDDYFRDVVPTPPLREFGRVWRLADDTFSARVDLVMKHLQARVDHAERTVAEWEALRDNDTAIEQDAEAFLQGLQAAKHRLEHSPYVLTADEVRRQEAQSRAQPFLTRLRSAIRRYLR